MTELSRFSVLSGNLQDLFKKDDELALAEWEARKLRGIINESIKKIVNLLEAEVTYVKKDNK
jgi:hypothetical protein